MTASWHPCPITAAEIARVIASDKLRHAKDMADTHGIRSAWSEMQRATAAKMRAEIEAAR